MRHRWRVRLAVSALIMIARAAIAQVPAPWAASTAYAGVAYFLFASGEVARYDMAAGAWLSPLPVSSDGTAMAVGPRGIFLGFGRRIARIALTGGPEQHLTNTAGDVRELVLGGPLIAALGNGQGLLSVDSATGAILDASTSFYAYYGLSGLSAAPTRRQVFGRSQGLSPSDIVVETLAANGTFIGEADSPYHGDYPSAARTFVFPGDARVADDAGIVYTANALAYAGSLAGPLVDLAFHGDFPIVLRGGQVIAYDAALRELGRHAVPDGTVRIFVHDGVIFAFRGAGSGLAVESIPVSALTSVTPGDPVDPNGLAFAIDGFAQGNDGTAYLLSRGNLSIFRWSPAARAYGATIPLRDAPQYLAYSSATNRLYVAYPSGMITQIDLDISDLERVFVTSPQSPCGLATAGDVVFVCDPSGAWVSHFTYAPDGELLSQVEWNYYSTEYVWSPELRRMYFFRDDTSPNDIIWEEIDAGGQIGSQQDSPYHGDFTFRHPIRLGPESSTVLTGEGLFFDPITLTHTASLSNRIDDAIWAGDTLLTIRRLVPVPDFYEPQEPSWGVTEVQAWGPGNHPLLWRRQIPGLPRRIFLDGATPIVVTSIRGVPQFTPLTCGDGIVDAYEQCDGTALAGQSCEGLGLGGGTLACAAGCSFDTSGCTTRARCGDGVVDQASEVCDGGDLGVVASCTAAGFIGGTLACAADCANYDTSGCNSCGNGVIDFAEGEQCDGDDLGSWTCEARGFPGGTLRCHSDCTLDEDGCQRDCAASPCAADDDACTVDACSAEAGCTHDPIDGCAALSGYLVTRASATIHRGGVTADCSGRCGDTTISPLVLFDDGTYSVPTTQPDFCPGETIVIPDETGTIDPGSRGREMLRPSNLDELLDATARCGGFKIKQPRYKAWIRRDGTGIVDGRSSLVTTERRDGVTFHVRSTARFAGPGQEIEPPRGFEKLSSCATGLRLKCRVR